jgi:hypothetical protein
VLISANASLENLTILLSNPNLLKKHPRRSEILNELFDILYLDNNFSRRMVLAKLIGGSARMAINLNQGEHRRFLHRLLEMVQANENESMLIGYEIMERIILADSSHFLGTIDVLITGLRHKCN